jgi:hypothetical protein
MIVSGVVLESVESALRLVIAVRSVPWAFESVLVFTVNVIDANAAPGAPNKVTSAATTRTITRLRRRSARARRDRGSTHNTRSS